MALYPGAPILAIYNSNANAAYAAGVSIFDFEDVVIDTHAAVTTGAAWKFTAPATGYYLVCGVVSLDAILVSKVVDTRIYKNGALYGSGARVQTNATETLSSSFSHIVQLSATDYIDVRVNNGDVANRNASAAASFNQISVIQVS